MKITRQVHLRSRPQGWPTPDNFEIVEVALPPLGEGEVLVRNTVMSVDPYMRPRMNDVPSYIAPFQLGAPLDGGAVGEVVESRHPSFEPGDIVLHGAGWREDAILRPGQLRKIDVEHVPASVYLGVLGMPGLTAYVGITRIAALREGDRVFISGAAGAVGSAAGQIAKALGASVVIGSAGSPEKVAWLTDDLGFDAALDYRSGDIRDLLNDHAPFDVYFDNVGGDHLEAAITHIADQGRMALCGSIAAYNDPAPGPRNMWQVVSKRLSLRGFIVSDHGDLASEFYRRAPRWVADGALRYRETRVKGLDRAADAFIGLHRGQNTGKMLVEL